MHTLQRAGLLVLLAGVFSGSSAGAQDRTRFPMHVLIIRHAEKTGEKTDVHLSRQGAERADMLFLLFELSAKRPEPLPMPDFIIAASDSPGSCRPFETIAPLARKIKVPINQAFASKPSAKPHEDGNGKPASANGIALLRTEIFGNAKYHGKTILVSWRHSTIPELARTLGAQGAPAKWDAEVFDRVWQITFDGREGLTFRDRPQCLLPGDAEK